MLLLTRKYTWVLAVWVLLCSSQSFAQAGKESTDALLLKLEKATQDTEKVNLLVKIAGSLFQSAPDSSLQYSQQGMEIAEKANYDRGKAELMLNMGNIYYVKGEPPRQLDYYLKSLKIWEQLDDKTGIAQCLNNMGNFYLSQGESAKARENFERALKIRRSLGKKNAVAGTLNNLGNVHLQDGQYQQAIDYYNQALLINEETGNKHSAAITLGNIGLIYSRQENEKRALEYYERALELRVELNQKNGIALLNNRIGGIFTQQGKYGQAIARFSKALAIAEEIGGKSYMETAYEGLAEAHEARGEYRIALEYFKEYSEVQTSIYNQESAQAIAEMEAKYKAEKREMEREQELQERVLKDLENEARLGRARILTFALVIGIVLILILAFVLFNQTRLKQRANDELERQVQNRTRELSDSNEQLEYEIHERKKTEEDLLRTNEELNTFIYKSSHDIKSPLTSIKGLVEIAASETGENAQQKQYFALIQERIGHLDTILERLIQNVRMKEGIIENNDVDIDAFWKEFQPRMAQISGIKKVEVKFEHDLKRPFYTDKSILETLLTNLISNAVTFRKQEGDEKPWCRISFRLEGDENLVLSVSDNGIGVSEKVKPRIFDMFYRGSLASRGTGLGLYIAKNLVRKMKGKISVKTEEGKGSVFTVVIPESSKGDEA